MLCCKQGLNCVETGFASQTWLMFNACTSSYATTSYGGLASVRLPYLFFHACQLDTLQHWTGPHEERLLHATRHAGLRRAAFDSGHSAHGRCSSACMADSRQSGEQVQPKHKLHTQSPGGMAQAGVRPSHRRVSRRRPGAWPGRRPAHAWAAPRAWRPWPRGARALAAPAGTAPGRARVGAYSRRCPPPRESGTGRTRAVAARAWPVCHWRRIQQQKCRPVSHCSG